YRFLDANIKKSFLLNSDRSEPDAPPHIELELASLLGTPQLHSSWVLAESRWADAFPLPHPREVILWTIKILPVFLGSSMRRLTRHHLKTEHNVRTQQAAPVGRSRRMSSVKRFLAVLLGVIAPLALVPMMVVIIDLL